MTSLSGGGFVGLSGGALGGMKFSVNENAFYSSNLSSLYSEFAFFPQQARLEMREYVREMFYHGYKGYMKYAFPHDELNPINCSGRGPDQNQLVHFLTAFSVCLLFCLAFLGFDMFSFLKTIFAFIV